MAPSTTPTKSRSGYLWEDMVLGRKHIVNNRNGDHVMADRLGSHLPVCRVGVSGMASSSARPVQSKAELLNRSLIGPEPKRPGRLADDIADERVSTMGRYRIRPVSESELWLIEARIQRKLFPERFEAERLADLKFRKKVEEAHKNYGALEVSARARGKRAVASWHAARSTSRWCARPMASRRAVTGRSTAFHISTSWPTSREPAPSLVSKTGSARPKGRRPRWL